MELMDGFFFLQLECPAAEVRLLEVGRPATIPAADQSSALALLSTRFFILHHQHSLCCSCSNRCRDGAAFYHSNGFS